MAGVSTAIPEDSSDAPLAAHADEAIRRFHELYYTEPTMVVEWLGVKALKCPLDLWTYQEIIHRARPDVIIETGSGRGGTTLFLASLCELMGAGRVISIDTRPVERPAHERITYLIGSSVDTSIRDRVRAAVQPAETVMVVLDSDHTKDHVLAELRAYAPLVSKGHYLIVEDTNVNGHPVFAEHGPGPMEAVREFLAKPLGRAFEVDHSCERFLLTMNPSGFLRRTGSRA
jgi:cephalosporin hydroxylase